MEGRTGLTQLIYEALGTQEIVVPLRPGNFFTVLSFSHNLSSILENLVEYTFFNGEFNAAYFSYKSLYA